MRGGRERRVREHTRHGDDQSNLLQAVHAGPLYRGRMVGRAANVEEPAFPLARGAAATEGQMRMPTWLQEDRRQRGSIGATGEQQFDLAERLPATCGQLGKVSQRKRQVDSNLTELYRSHCTWYTDAGHFFVPLYFKRTCFISTLLRDALVSE